MSTQARPTKRSYNSARRARQAAQTRADIVQGSIRLFAEHGWAGTTLAGIAEEVGVSVETIYNGFGSKKGLLRVAMDVAVAGDAVEVPLADRPEFAALSEGDMDERVGKVADMVVAIHERSASVWQAIVEAASGDPELAEWRLEMEAGRRIDVGRGAAALVGHPPDERLVTLLWLFWGPESYQKLVVDEGLSVEEYRDIVIDGTRRLIGLAG